MTDFDLSGTLVLRMNDVVLIVRYTRHWIHYGLLAHIGICIVIGAVKGLAGQ